MAAAGRLRRWLGGKKPCCAPLPPVTGRKPVKIIGFPASARPALPLRHGDR